MAREVRFGTVKNAEGESDVRMNAETVPERNIPLTLSEENEISIQHLKEIGEFFKTRREDDLLKDHDMNPIHIHLINDMLKRLEGNKLYLNDGSREMLLLQHRHLKLDRVKK